MSQAERRRRSRARRPSTSRATAGGRARAGRPALAVGAGGGADRPPARARGAARRSRGVPSRWRCRAGTSPSRSTRSSTGRADSTPSARRSCCSRRSCRVVLLTRSPRSHGAARAARRPPAQREQRADRSAEHSVADRWEHWPGWPNAGEAGRARRPAGRRPTPTRSGTPGPETRAGDDRGRPHGGRGSPRRCWRSPASTWSAWGYSPGGGFPAGAVILGVVLLLYAGFGRRRIAAICPPGARRDPSNSPARPRSS